MSECDEAARSRLIDRMTRMEALAAQVTHRPALRLELLREAWEIREHLDGLSKGVLRSWAPRQGAP